MKAIQVEIMQSVTCWYTKFMRQTLTKSLYLYANFLLQSEARLLFHMSLFC
jgi:hypothetical protein